MLSVLMAMGNPPGAPCASTRGTDVAHPAWLLFPPPSIPTASVLRTFPLTVACLMDSWHLAGTYAVNSPRTGTGPFRLAGLGISVITKIFAGWDTDVPFKAALLENGGSERITWLSWGDSTGQLLGNSKSERWNLR